MSIVVPSNYVNIIRAIEQIGLQAQSAVNGVKTPYTGSKLYAPPTLEQITAAGGTPFLAINRGQLAGYAIGGELIGSDAARGVQSTEPVWDFEVYAFHPYDPLFPDYDDAADNMNVLWLQFMEEIGLPYQSTIQASPAPTSTVVAVSPGDGRRFSAFKTAAIENTVTPVIIDITGDVITFNAPHVTPPQPGMMLSQATCDASYPYGNRPDYAELTDGSPWSVSYVVVRAMEQLLTNFS